VMWLDSKFDLVHCGLDTWAGLCVGLWLDLWAFNISFKTENHKQP
jgi:hypothetical protein